MCLACDEVCVTHPLCAQVSPPCKEGCGLFMSAVHEHEL